MNTAKRLRERMIKVQEGQFAFFMINRKVIPELTRAVEELRDSLAVKDVSIPEAQKALSKLSDQIRALEETTELDRQAVYKIAAAVAVLLEEGELQHDRMHEMAQLATLQQYFEIAAKGSKPFWIDLLKMVDVPVFMDAFSSLPLERQEELSGIKISTEQGVIK